MISCIFGFFAMIKKITQLNTIWEISLSLKTFIQDLYNILGNEVTR